MIGDYELIHLHGRPTHGAMDLPDITHFMLVMLKGVYAIRVSFSRFMLVLLCP